MGYEIKPTTYDNGAEAVEAIGPSYNTEGDVFIPPTPEESKAVIRKLDKRLLPFILVLYSFSILDRSNLGNAKIAGMTKDINLGGLRYNWLGTIFYIAYITFQFQTAFWKKFPPHRWAVWCIFFWGLISSVQAATHTWGGLMACRFLLGVAEAGFGPGVPLYLSFFYPKDKVGFRQGVFISGAALANAYGGALAYGITQIKGSLRPWRILFLIEGLPTILLAVAAWFLIPDSIDKAKFLSPREKEVARHGVATNQVLDAPAASGLKLKQFAAGFADPRSYFPAILYFGVNVSYASLPLFVPTIISEIGIFSTIQAQGLSSPPYLLAFFAILGTTWLSDRYQLRGPFITIFASIAAVGFILLATCTSPVARYIGVYLAILIFVCVPLILTWVANTHADESKRAGGYIVLQAIGQCGPLLGTNLFPANEKPFYRKGMWVSTGMCLMVAVTAVFLDVWYAWDNRKMDKLETQEMGAEKAGERPGEETGRRIRYVL